MPVEGIWWVYVGFYPFFLFTNECICITTKIENG